MFLLSLILDTYDQYVRFDSYELEGDDSGREFKIIHIYNWKEDHEINRFVTYSEGQFTADPFGNRLIATVIVYYENACFTAWFFTHNFWDNGSITFLLLHYIHQCLKLHIVKF